MASVEELDRRIEALRKERAVAVKREKKLDGELKAQAAQAIGEAFLACHGGDWKTVDFDALASRLEGEPSVLRRRAPMSLQEARHAIARFKKCCKTSQQSGPQSSFGQGGPADPPDNVSLQ